MMCDRPSKQIDGVTMLIIDRLVDAIDKKQCPVVVGLDPLLESIPSFIKDRAKKEFGNTLRGAAEAIFLFNQQLLNTLHTIIPAVKLQMACYELYGKWGFEVFLRTVNLAGRLGLIVIDDSKRNDIGSTATLYAMGHLGNPPLFEGVHQEPKPDFLTVNPYLGDDSITPFVEQCRLNKKGLFILVRTSNASAAQYQEAVIDGMPLYQKIATDLQKLSLKDLGINGFSPFGAVVGATWPEETRTLRQVMPNVFFLMPGYGAQGATSAHVVEAFNQEGYGALINSSRGVIFAYRSSLYRDKYPKPESFDQASFEAVVAMRDDLLRSLRQAGRLPKNW